MEQGSGEHGILSIQELPQETWDDRWDGIVVPEVLKDRILNFGLFALMKRDGISSVRMPIHGLLLFSGVPGTGKTTLARGLANRIAGILKKDYSSQTAYCEVDAYRMASGLLGESQKHVERLFYRSIPNLAKTYDRLIVLLDEVENVAVSRAKASLDANPVDVHRATNAFLTGLDYVSENHRNVLLLATTNHQEVLDTAMLSRVDVRQLMELPPPSSLAQMVVETVRDFADADDVSEEQLVQLGKALDGLDGRQARKQVLEAIIASRDVALAPRTLSVDDVIVSLQSKK